MAVYRFKVAFEEHEDISREIEIKSIQTFEDFHYAIQEAIGFDAAHPASFYMSNDHWKKGQEISLYKQPPRNGEANVQMKDAILCDWIADPHQKIYYVFDYNAQWTFYIELIRIFPYEDSRRKYPLCVKIHGEAPRQKVVIIPVKDDELDLPEDEEVKLIEDDYTHETGDEEDKPEVLFNEEEADEITDEEQLTEKGGPEEEEV